MHRAATTGTPSDVVGAALPLASGFAFGRMIGGGGPVESPSSEGLTFPRGVDLTQGGPFSTPDLVTPSRPVAGFVRDIARAAAGSRARPVRNDANALRASSPRQSTNLRKRDASA